MSNIIESYKWLTPEFAITPTDGKTVKIRGKAIPRETVSRNNKKYVDEELRKAARTFIDVPITENHKDWRDKKNHLGKVNWMEYDDGSMEYVAEVWNPTMAEELRFYAKNPSKSQIHGVSVEADFLKIACAKCKHEFLTESDWRKHMKEVEHIHDLPLEPHGIRGRALSIVTGHESPGVVGNTLEVMETVDPLLRLLETVIKINMEKEKMQNNTPPKIEPQTGPPYTVKEQTAPASVEPPSKVIHHEPPAIAETKPAPKETPPQKTVIEKLSLKAHEKFSIDQCMASGKSKEECMAMYDKDCETKEVYQQFAEKLNQIVEWANALKFPDDDLGWKQIKPYDDATLKQGYTILTEALANTASKKELQETIAGIKPYDDSALKEALANIKPYDDKPLKEMDARQEEIIANLNKNFLESHNALKETSKTLAENLAQTVQKPQLIEALKPLTEKLTALETENKALREEHGKVKEMYEKNLAAFEKDIKEYYKPIEQRTQELEKQLKETAEELGKTKNKLQETTTLAENTQDKLKPEFKGAAKSVVKETALPTSFNPYDPSRR